MGTIDLDKIIMETMNIIHRGNKINGLYEEYYGNCLLRLRVNYKDCRKTGLYERWHENGQMEIRANFKDGKEDGLYEKWYQNGQLAIRIKYEEGVIIPSTKEEMDRLSAEMAKKAQN